ncbi:O-antigen ligase family protein [bacterium SCSIO 12696]|nr:O-antigen ligase family protein [bacterium SCSIO 12696]
MLVYIKAFVVLSGFFVIASTLNRFFHGKDLDELGFFGVNTKKIIIVWLSITACVFVLQSIWLLYIGVIVASLSLRKNPDNDVLWFVFFLLIMPLYEAHIPGFAGIEYLLGVSYLSIVSLCFLFPKFLEFKNDKSKTPFGQLFQDKCIVILYLLVIFQGFRDNASVTGSVKLALVAFFEVIVPYAVISRLSIDKKILDSVFVVILLTGLFGALVNVFEFLRGWQLYRGTSFIVGSSSITESTFMYRGGYLRASSLFVHSIVNGYFMVVSLGAWYFCAKRFSPSFLFKYGTLFLLLAGLYCTSSRGPWVGAALFFVVVTVFLGKNRFRNLAYLGVFGLVSVFGLILLGQKERFLELLPFIGKEGVDSYRSKLIENGLEVFYRNPLLGQSSGKYLNEPEMLALIQGEGIIDIVNNYIALLLDYGLFGFLPYVLLFLSLMIAVNRVRKNSDDRTFLVSSVLIGLSISHLFIMGTVKDLGHIKPLSYMILAMMVGVGVLPKLRGAK